MMISDLPLDLVEEILTRVPATSLSRLRTTCRRWYALFKDQRFTEKHFRKAPKESMVAMLKEYRIFPMNVNLNVAPPSIEFQSALLGLKEPHSNSVQVDIVKVFHCEGLLLCTTKDNRLVVWNPCSGETRWIQFEDDNRYNWFTLGYIQNNKSCRSYKILRQWGYNNADQRFEIYEFSSDSWRVLDDAVLDCIMITENYSGVSSLKGHVYWLAKDTKERYAFVLSFDFTEERYKHLCRLPVFQNHGSVTLSVGREGQLSALNKSDNTLEMWITNRIDAETELLWSKSFIVDLPKSFHIFTSLLIDEEKKVSLYCAYNYWTNRDLVNTIGEDAEYYTQISFTNKLRQTGSRGWFPITFNYVPSLFQIQ